MVETQGHNLVSLRIRIRAQHQFDYYSTPPVSNSGQESDAFGGFGGVNYQHLAHHNMHKKMPPLSPTSTTKAQNSITSYLQLCAPVVVAAIVGFL